MVDYQQLKCPSNQIWLPFFQQEQDSVPADEQDHQLLHHQGDYFFNASLASP